MEIIIAKTKKMVEKQMSSYDASHDFNHIERVLALALKIQTAEQTIHPERTFNTPLVTLSALLHDIGDHKYVKPQEDSTLLAAYFLESIGADHILATTVQRIVNHVSYSLETRDPAAVQRAIAEIPELAIVQDADRLDALGAVGIGRAFIYGGARPAPDEGIEKAVHHFGEKLLRLEALMKTESGRTMARVRTAKVRAFVEWWKDEMAEAGFSGGS